MAPAPNTIFSHPPAFFPNTTIKDYVPFPSATLFVCADSFSRKYGVWGSSAAEKMGPWFVPGQRVAVSEKRLRADCVPDLCENTLVLVTDKRMESTVGYVFATCWSVEGRKVCWITQLCVMKAYRRRGLGTALLREVRKEVHNSTHVFGILSSNPAAMMAFARTLGPGISHLDLARTRSDAKAIMRCSSVRYVRNARLQGSLFEPLGRSIPSIAGVDTTSAISCAYTDFWIDHSETDVMLKTLGEKEEEREKGGLVWPLGGLPEGCEFVAVIENEGASIPSPERRE